MAGQFEGLTDMEWKVVEDLFPQPEKRGRGMPAVPQRNVLNSLLYILFTECRWCDLPRGEQWASKSSRHRWLKRWYEDGTLEKIQARVLGLAHHEGLICWNYGAVDGSFSPWQRWRETLTMVIKEMACHFQLVQQKPTGMRGHKSSPYWTVLSCKPISPDVHLEIRRNWQPTK